VSGIGREWGIRAFEGVLRDEINPNQIRRVITMGSVTVRSKFKSVADEVNTELEK